MAKLPEDDAGAKLMRFEDVRTQRYTEIFLIGGNVFKLVGGVYNTIGLNGPNGNGDTCPQEILDGVEVDALTKEYHTIGAFKNGPRLWCVDWVEVMVGEERDFNGLKARWVMWLDVPKEMRKHESVAYKSICRQARHPDRDQQGLAGLPARRSRRQHLVHEVGEPDRRPEPDLREPQGPRRSPQAGAGLEVPDPCPRGGPGADAGQRRGEDHPGRAR